MKPEDQEALDNQADSATPAAAEDAGEATPGSEADTGADEGMRDDILKQMGATGKDPEATPEAEEQEHEDLPAETKARIEARIGKEVSKRKALEERLAEATEEAKTAREEAKKLQTALSEAEVGATKAGGVNPLFLATSEEQIEQHQEKLAGWKSWLIENIDGYEGDGSEKDPSYSAKDIRRKLAEIESELSVGIPRAKAMLLERLKQTKVIREAYPGVDLKDPQSPAAIEIARAYRANPMLKADPKGTLLILDAMAGRLLREMKARERQRGSGGLPPRIGGSGSVRSEGVTTERNTDQDEQILKRGKYSRESLQKFLESKMG